MPRFSALLLLLAFVLPSALPLFALGPKADAGLPACCRRNGAHHCGMSLAEQQQSVEATQSARWQAPLQRCPYCPATLNTVHPNFLTVPAERTAFTDSFSHPAGLVQTESRWRIARDRSRQKRGPPALTLA